MPESDPLGLSGQVLADKYAVDRVVGSGGFAVVYRAHHKIWNQPVAIKFFSGLSSAPPDQREALREAFIKEGALLSELSSQTANIVQARDVGTVTTADGQWLPYMVLEWLEGKTLDELMSDSALPGAPPWTLSEVVRILKPVAGALEIAHQRGIAHRDVKPGNLFVVGADPRDPKSSLKLLDFGVAKMIDAPLLKPTLAKTGVGFTSFTPQYGAPEQFSRGYGATGPWTDVFALALVAVELLTASPALDGDDVVQLGYSAARPDMRPTPNALGLALPDAVDQVFKKALAPQPSERYETAGEFWSALEAAAGFVSIVSRAPSPVSVDPSSATMVAPSAHASLGAEAARTTGGAPQTTAPVDLGARPSSGGKRIGVAIAGLAAVAAVAVGALALRGKSQTPSSAPPSAAVAVAPPPVSASASAAAVHECSADMAKIPAGEYFMGSEQKDAAPNEHPVHHVKLGTYCMDMNEVTTDQYKACSDVGKCRRAPSEAEWPKITPGDRKAYGTACNVNDPSHGNHPINCVTWEMAERYCRAQGKRLPTEAEWEYAARGPDGRYYPWGDDPPTAKHLNACGKECVQWAAQHQMELGSLYDADDGYPTTAPVGSFPAGSSRFGPHDVVGNVWEWVQDWYGDYTSAELDNPSGPASGERRVIRGGGWDGRMASWLRPSFRFGQVPDARSPGIGFRCAKSLD